jgi:hypothetical protein
VFRLRLLSGAKRPVPGGSGRAAQGRLRTNRNVETLSPRRSATPDRRAAHDDEPRVFQMAQDSLCRDPRHVLVSLMDPLATDGWYAM